MTPEAQEAKEEQTEQPMTQEEQTFLSGTKSPVNNST